MQRQKNQKRRGSKGMLATKIIAVVAAFVVVFRLGVAAGQGDLRFGGDAVFSKTTSKHLPDDLDYSSVEDVYDTLRRDFDGKLTTAQLLEGLKKGLAKASGDEHTEYLNTKESRELDEDLSGTFSGIGAELGKKENAIVIVSPIAGFPAEKAGLKAKDVIAEIDGKPAYDISVGEAVNKIRGPINTKVKLKVIRDNKQELDFEITRQTISIPSVETKVLPGNIGYMKISRFAEDTAKLATEGAEKFKTTGVKGVVVDVRNDPGGLLDASVDVASLWLPADKTVLQEKRDGVVIKTYRSNGDATLLGIPTVVLINEGSASASEILAGALHDNKAATLMGTKSYGKGSVQKLEPLPDGSTLKVTIARWYTPNGKNIDKAGIQPDKQIELTEDDAKNQRDPQQDEAVKSLQ